MDKLPKIVEVLRKETKASPSKLASQIHSDRRTVDRILNAATNLGIVDCNKLEVSGRTFQVCQLTPEFKRLIEARKK